MKLRKIPGAEGQNSADLILPVEKEFLDDLFFVCHVQHEAVDNPISEDFVVPLKFKPFTPIFDIRSVQCTSDGSAIEQITVDCSDNREYQAKPR